MRENYRDVLAMIYDDLQKGREIRKGAFLLQMDSFCEMAVDQDIDHHQQEIEEEANIHHQAQGQAFLAIVSFIIFSIAFIAVKAQSIMVSFFTKPRDSVFLEIADEITVYFE